METNGGSEFKIPLISTNELEAKSVACNSSQEDGTEGGTSLPALTNELIEAQYSQCAKIAEGQKSLCILKEKIKEEKEKQTRIAADVHSIAKLICLAQDEAASTEAECCSSRNELFSLAKENASLQSRMLDYEHQLESNQRLHTKYYQKMDGHGEKVNDIEHSHELYQQVVILQENISKMNNQKTIELMGSDNVHVSDEVKKLQEKLCALEASKEDEVINQVKCSDLGVANSNIIHQLQVDIGLLKKRQQAQLTRMHRQVQSLRHCSEKSRKLLSEIQQLKMKMDQEHY